MNNVKLHDRRAVHDHLRMEEEWLFVNYLPSHAISTLKKQMRLITPMRPPVFFINNVTVDTKGGNPTGTLGCILKMVETKEWENEDEENNAVIHEKLDDGEKQTNKQGHK